MMFLFLALLHCLFSLLVVHAQYLPTAEIAWRRQLQGKMRRGNGVEVTRDGVLVATTDNGFLHIFQKNALEPVVYAPTTVIVDNTNSNPLQCRGRPVLASPEVVVYAVSNYVVAVNITNATTLFSTAVPNTVVGTPALSRRGASIYVTHNDKDNIGSISVLGLTTGRLLATLPGTVPFGPPAVTHRTNNADDIVIFGDATDAGYSSKFANLFALRWDADQHSIRHGVGAESYEIVVAATGVRATSQAVAFTSDLRVYMATQGSFVIAFDRNEQYNLFNQRSPATPWTVQLELNSTNALARTYPFVVVVVFGSLVDCSFAPLTQ